MLSVVFRHIWASEPWKANRLKLKWEMRRNMLDFMTVFSYRNSILICPILLSDRVVDVKHFEKTTQFGQFYLYPNNVGDMTKTLRLNHSESVNWTAPFVVALMISWNHRDRIQSSLGVFNSPQNSGTIMAFGWRPLARYCIRNGPMWIWLDMSWAIVPISFFVTWSWQVGQV